MIDSLQPSTGVDDIRGRLVRTMPRELLVDLVLLPSALLKAR